MRGLAGAGYRVSDRFRTSSVSWDIRANLSVLLMIGFTGVMLVGGSAAGVIRSKRPSLLLRWRCFSPESVSCSTPRFSDRRRTVADRGALHRRDHRENLKLYEQLNISADQITLIRENAPEITQFFAGIFPALALSGAILTVWLNVLAGRSLLRRHAEDFPILAISPYGRRRNKLVWLLIASGGMMLAPRRRSG